MSRLVLQDLAVVASGRTLVEAVSLEIADGVLVIAGGASSGKTTLVETIAGSRAPSRGTVALDGGLVDPRTVGIQTQEHDLVGGLTAAENVAVRLLRDGGVPAGGLDRVEETLAELLLPPSSWHNLVDQLSGGQQQRVAVARALVDDAPLIVLDDPTSELDDRSAAAVWAAIDARAARGSVVVVASPDSEDAARGSAVLRL